MKLKTKNKLVSVLAIALASPSAFAGIATPIDEPSTMAIIAGVAGVLGFIKWKNRNK